MSLLLASPARTRRPRVMSKKPKVNPAYRPILYNPYNFEVVIHMRDSQLAYHMAKCRSNFELSKMDAAAKHYRDHHPWPPYIKKLKALIRAIIEDADGEPTLEDYVRPIAREFIYKATDNDDLFIPAFYAYFSVGPALGKELVVLASGIQRAVLSFASCDPQGRA